MKFSGCSDNYTKFSGPISNNQETFDCWSIPPSCWVSLLWNLFQTDKHRAREFLPFITLDKNLCRKYTNSLAKQFKEGRLIELFCLDMFAQISFISSSRQVVFHSAQGGEINISVDKPLPTHIRGAETILLGTFRIRYHSIRNIQNKIFDEWHIA